MTIPIHSLQHFAEDAAPAQEANPQLDAWLSQAEATKAVYPGFDLAAELENPQFRNLLRSQVDVATAYEVLHKQELLVPMLAQTAKAVEEKLVSKLTALGVRPRENGNAAQGAAISKADVSHMSKADRQAIIKRVQSGEKITF